MTGTVVVVAKAPRPGWAKTRLVPPLDAEDAADVARALLLDTVTSVLGEGHRALLLCPSDEDARVLRGLVAGVDAVVQRGRGLADALRLAIADATRGGEPCLVVSSDLPGLPPGALAAAREALGDADVVLGPASDGGYWLIGMREPHEAPFRAIPWSTPACLAVTLARCAEAGLRVAQLEPWTDVDTAVDLADVAAGDGAGPRTRAVLDHLARRGVLGPPRPFRVVRSTLVEATPWRSVLRDEVVDPAGGRRSYLYMAVPRAVFIVPVTPAGEIVLVGQYRHPVRDRTLEVPAGSVDEGESPEAAARRELAEETGGRSDRWTHLGTFFSSSAHLSLRSDAYLARDVRLGTPSRHAEEQLDVVLLPVGDVLRRARAGGFPEGQTALALLLAAPLLENPTAPRSVP